MVARPLNREVNIRLVKQEGLPSYPSVSIYWSHVTCRTKPCIKEYLLSRRALERTSLCKWTFSHNGWIWSFCLLIIVETRHGCAAGLAGRAQHTVLHPHTVQIKLYHRPKARCGMDQHNKQADKGLMWGKGPMFYQTDNGGRTIGPQSHKGLRWLSQPFLGIWTRYQAPKKINIVQVRLTSGG